MRLKDVVVGREYVLGDRYDRSYSNRNCVSVTVLSTSYHRWLFKPVAEGNGAFVQVAVAGVIYAVPEELTVLRSGGTKGALITWIGRADQRLFSVVSASQIMMSAHDYELVMAKEIAKDEQIKQAEQKKVDEARRVRAKEVAAFNAVFRRRLANRPNELTPRSLGLYVDDGYYMATTKLAMRAALWGAGSKATK
jgi:hypothetical protein